jgi:hypothetical protein
MDSQKLVSIFVPDEMSAAFQEPAEDDASATEDDARPADDDAWTAAAYWAVS